MNKERAPPLTNEIVRAAVAALERAHVLPGPTGYYILRPDGRLEPYIPEEAMTPKPKKPAPLPVTQLAVLAGYALGARPWEKLSPFHARPYVVARGKLIEKGLLESIGVAGFRLSDDARELFEQGLEGQPLTAEETEMEDTLDRAMKEQAEKDLPNRFTLSREEMRAEMKGKRA